MSRIRRQAVSVLECWTDRFGEVNGCPPWSQERRHVPGLGGKQNVGRRAYGALGCGLQKLPPTDLQALTTLSLGLLLENLEAQSLVTASPKARNPSMLIYSGITSIMCEAPGCLPRRRLAKLVLRVERVESRRGSSGSWNASDATECALAAEDITRSRRTSPKGHLSTLPPLSPVLTKSRFGMPFGTAGFRASEWQRS